MVALSQLYAALQEHLSLKQIDKHMCSASAAYNIPYNIPICWNLLSSHNNCMHKMLMLFIFCRQQYGRCHWHQRNNLARKEDCIANVVRTKLPLRQRVGCDQLLIKPTTAAAAHTPSLPLPLPLPVPCCCHSAQTARQVRTNTKTADVRLSLVMLM